MENEHFDAKKMTQETIAECKIAAQGGGDLHTKSVGSRGGNDMISGAENWDDIPFRFREECVKAAENSEKVRAAGDGKLDPSDEHALSPSVEFIHSPITELVKTMNWLLQGIEQSEAFCIEAEKKGDSELNELFSEIMQNCNKSIIKAKKIFSNYSDGLAQGLH